MSVKCATSACIGVALVVLGGDGASAQRPDLADAIATNPRGVVTTLARLARTFQSPTDSMNTWGDPSNVKGTYEPEVQFYLVKESEPSRHLWIRLFYFPPAKQPRRLAYFDIRVYPAPDEPQAIQWLGEPRRRERLEMTLTEKLLFEMQLKIEREYEQPPSKRPKFKGAVVLYYDGFDRANLGVRHIHLDPAERRKGDEGGMTIRLDGTPR